MKYRLLIQLQVLSVLLLTGCSGEGPKPSDISASSSVPEKAMRSVEDIDGNVYGIVRIGSQDWMSENLRTTRYCNGDEIHYGQENATWQHARVGMYCSYDHDQRNSDVYGALYNWYAVDDDRGLCPSGWHVPTDQEWNSLEGALGLPIKEARESGGRGGHGRSMKSDSWNGTNESGFSALPGGFRTSYNGSFIDGGDYAHWWSSSEWASFSAWHRTLDSLTDYVTRYNIKKANGLSVRCVRDKGY